MTGQGSLLPCCCPQVIFGVPRILQSKAFLSCINDGNSIAFSLPSKCPVKKAPTCTLTEAEPEVSEIDTSEAPPVDEDTDNGKNKNKKENKKRLILVESEIRRSPRVKVNKKCVKDPVCKDKRCLGCNSKPPTLSTKTIRKLSSSLCDIEASLVTDEALGKLKKAGAPNNCKKTGVQNRKKKKASPM